MLMNFQDIDVFMNVGGWKHGKIIDAPNEIELLQTVDAAAKPKINVNKTIQLFANNKVNFLVLVKNPYLWIYSISKYENKEITTDYVIRHIKTWNAHYSNYKNYIEQDKAFLVKYETFIKHPNETMDKIKQKFNLTSKNSNYKFEQKHFLANGDSNGGGTTNTTFDNSPYMNEQQYISTYLTSSIINTITHTLDSSLMEFYQYDIL